MFFLIENIASWALNLINSTGYAGLFLTMVLESMAVPIPSEVVAPFGGFLASTGRFEFWLVVLVITIGNLVGSVALYIIGYYGGSAFLHKYGKYFLIHEEEIKKMDRWFQKHGRKVAFFSRLIPGTRTFSSLVIGSGETSFSIFFWYTLAGSFIWNLIWVYLGFIAGERWNQFRPYVRKLDYLIITVIIISVAVFVYRHIRRRNKR